MAKKSKGTAALFIEDDLIFRKVQRKAKGELLAQYGNLPLGHLKWAARTGALQNIPNIGPAFCKQILNRMPGNVEEVTDAQVQALQGFVPQMPPPESEPLPQPPHAATLELMHDVQRMQQELIEQRAAISGLPDPETFWEEAREVMGNSIKMVGHFREALVLAEAQTQRLAEAASTLADLVADQVARYEAHQQGEESSPQGEPSSPAPATQQVQQQLAEQFDAHPEQVDDPVQPDDIQQQNRHTLWQMADELGWYRQAVKDMCSHTANGQDPMALSDGVWQQIFSNLEDPGVRDWYHAKLEKEGHFTTQQAPARG